MPTYKAKTETYTTGQGDMWDMIALTEYGDEHCMHFLQDANFEHRFVDLFPANVVLVIPREVTIGNDLKHRVEIPTLKQLLPWR